MRYAGLSDLGKTRSSNQDEFVTINDKHGNFLAVVCDGVGGANHGEIASSMTANSLKERFENNDGFSDLEDAQAWLFSTIKKINQTIIAKGKENDEYKGMGTTLVAFLKTEYGSLIANVGDSRAYVLNRDRSFRVATKDHSYVYNLVQNGQITLQEALVHPQRHVITNAVGIWNDITVDFFPVSDMTEYVLLCSDGLHDYVTEKLIASVMRDKRFSVETKVQKLVKAADDAGGYDNVTVVIVQLEDGDSDE